MTELTKDATLLVDVDRVFVLENHDEAYRICDRSRTSIREDGNIPWEARRAIALEIWLKAFFPPTVESGLATEDTRLRAFA